MEKKALIEEKSLSQINLDTFAREGEKYGINIFPEPSEIKKIWEGIIHLTEKPPSGSILLELKKQGYSENVRIGGSFYTKVIKPWLATGPDAYKPSLEDVVNFCDILTTNGADLVFYYALSKTRSPQRTGSPNWIIDFAEFEMLKYWVLVTKIAQELGLKLRMILVDETTVLPFDDVLGLNQKDLETNQRLFMSYLEKNDNPPIIYRSLLESVTGPLGGNFEEIYQLEKEKTLTEIKKQLNSDLLSPDIIRIATFLDCLPQSTLETYGISLDYLNYLLYELKKGNISILSDLNPELFSYILSLTAHLKSIMNLRSEAMSQANQQNLINKYPEYRKSRIYGGVTRSSSRWSFLPLPTKYQGLTVNPMHGLAVYNADNFLGVCQKRNLPPNGQIIYLDKKPLFVII